MAARTQRRRREERRLHYALLGHTAMIYTSHQPRLLWSQLLPTNSRSFPVLLGVTQDPNYCSPWLFYHHRCRTANLRCYHYHPPNPRGSLLQGSSLCVCLQLGTTRSSLVWYLGGQGLYDSSSCPGFPASSYSSLHVKLRTCLSTSRKKARWQSDWDYIKVIN